NTSRALALFNGQPVMQVTVGRSESGGERVVALGEQWTYSTDDSGQSWHPYFYGLTRRTLKQIATAPSAPGTGAMAFWIAAGGEIWSTKSPPQPGFAPIDLHAARWARRRIRNTPSLSATMNEAFGHLGLTARWISGLGGAARASAF